MCIVVHDFFLLTRGGARYRFSISVAMTPIPIEGVPHA